MCIRDSNEAPEVGTHPVDVTACISGTAVFTATAGATTGPSYQWQVDTGSGFGDILAAGAPNYSGFTTATLTIGTLSAATSGWDYRVVITGTCPGSVNSNPANLTIDTPAAITVQPSNATQCETTNATFTVTATGTSLSYQWEESTNGGVSWTSVGANSNSYTKVGVVTV